MNLSHWMADDELLEDCTSEMEQESVVIQEEEEDDDADMIDSQQFSKPQKKVGQN